MIRGLMIRQVFVLAEIALWVVILIIGAITLRDLYRPDAGAVAVSPSNELNVREVKLANAVDVRSNYDSILKSNIFAPAAKYQHNQPPAAPTATPAPPTNPNPTETKLPLVLKGAVALGPTDPFSSAIIDVKQQGIGQETFFIGDEIIADVFLLEVYGNEVLLDNRKANRHEILKHELDFKNAGASRGGVNATLAQRTPSETAPSRRVRTNASTLVTLQRDDIVSKLEADYERLASTIDVLEVRDKDGNLQGLSTNNIESISSLNELGFKNGDILVSVNNEKVTGQDQMTALANKYRNASIVRVGILRDGQPLNKTYRIR